MKCGKQNDEDSSFCESCGQTITKKISNKNIVPTISFLKAIELGYRRTPDFKSRSRRSEYWWWILFTSIINFSLGLVPIIGILTSLILLIPTISVTTRRLHDINLTGWWQAPILALGILGNFLPQSYYSSNLSLILIFMLLACLAIFIYWTAKDGDKDSNKYGDNPKFPRA